MIYSGPHFGVTSLILPFSMKNDRYEVEVRIIGDAPGEGNEKNLFAEIEKEGVCFAGIVEKPSMNGLNSAWLAGPNRWLRPPIAKIVGRRPTPKR